MRSFEETLSRWRATMDCSESVATLQCAVKDNGSASPCLSGCRSVCWKTFLLSRETSSKGLPQILRVGRLAYGQERDRLLKFIHHPEALTELTIDPLTDDPESPWNTVRQDEIIRDEIRQDVQRLPDDVNYHESHIQNMILDILFVYCKKNPNRGGYRQGMHELLAPIIHVVEQDALNRFLVEPELQSDQSMIDVLDSAFIEHDAYLLFSRLMEHAQLFYEVREMKNVSSVSRSEPGYQEQQSAIVEKSRFIHEVCLSKIDEELASHLINIEILPQIFLIRWIRLLFNREFPFNQSLVLWDTLFAVDPSLALIDYICCAMLIRIRRQLLEADYSACLKLLLRYPSPTPPHGPSTFVNDAIWLRDNMNSEGGNALIEKYEGRMSDMERRSQTKSKSSSNHIKAGSSRTRGFGSRSPLPSPSRFIQQQGGMESLFQGAAKSAKGVFERGEKLGINQAVRDAVVEFRRNVQTFNETRQSTRIVRSGRGEETATETLEAMERRNRQLAALLDETVENLKEVSMSSLDDKTKSLELIETAAAKVQFVQVYLSDSSMEVPNGDILKSKEAIEEPSEGTGLGINKESDGEEQASELEAAVAEDERASTTSTPENDAHGSEQESGADAAHQPTPQKGEVTLSQSSSKHENDTHVRGPIEGLVRPKAPIPSRSTLAQSSFSWMLEPGESVSSQGSPPSSQFHMSQHRKRLSSNASRERNAFLFGEVAASPDTKETLLKDEIFGLEPILRNRSKS